MLNSSGKTHIKPILLERAFLTRIVSTNNTRYIIHLMLVKISTRCQGVLQTLLQKSSVVRIKNLHLTYLSGQIQTSSRIGLNY